MERLNLDQEIVEMRRERMLAQIDPEFNGVTADDMPPQVAEWCDNAVVGQRRPSLFLMGPTGTGKTHTALAVMMRLFEATSLAPRVVTAPVMCESLRPNGGATLDRYRNAQLLVLDDLGAEKVTGFVETVTLQVIDHRYRHKLPTIITTNVPADGLADMLGERVVSRIRGMCDTVIFDGPDLRRHENPPIRIAATAPR